MDECALFWMKNKVSSGFIYFMDVNSFFFKDKIAFGIAYNK